MQSCMTLDDFLPGFGPPVLRWANTFASTAEAVEIVTGLGSTERLESRLKWTREAQLRCKLRLYYTFLTTAFVEPL